MSLQRQEVIWVTPQSPGTIVCSHKYNLALWLHEAMYIMHYTDSSWKALTLFTSLKGLDWIRTIASSLANGRRIPGPPTISFFKAALVAPLKSCHPFFLYGCLWLLRRGEIAVIQMLSDFNTPVNITKERTTPSSTMHGKKDETSVFNILSFYLCSISSQVITSAESRLLDTYRTPYCVSLH